MAIQMHRTIQHRSTLRTSSPWRLPITATSTPDSATTVRPSIWRLRARISTRPCRQGTALSAIPRVTGDERHVDGDTARDRRCRLDCCPLFIALTPLQIRQRILTGVDPLADESKYSLTNGRLNLLNTLEDDDTPPAAINDLAPTKFYMTQVELKLDSDWR